MPAPGEDKPDARVDARKRRAKALELRLAGMTYDAIAQAVGYRSKASAHDAVEKALEEQAADPAMSDAVVLEMARLDAMLTGLWSKARRGDVAAIDRVLKIGTRRTELEALHRQANPTGVVQTPLDELNARRAAKGAAGPRAARRG